MSDVLLFAWAVTGASAVVCAARYHAQSRRTRAAVAGEIAAAIETSVCAPGEQCVKRFCPDCTRYRQALADAATARRIGGSHD
jgi:hypothetical protein